MSVWVYLSHLFYPCLAVNHLTTWLPYFMTTKHRPPGNPFSLELNRKHGIWGFETEFPNNAQYKKWHTATASLKPTICTWPNLQLLILLPAVLSLPLELRLIL